PLVAAPPDRAGQVRVHEHLPALRTTSVREEGLPERCVRILAPLCRLPAPGDSLRDRESLLGIANCRSEHGLERELAEATVERLPSRDTPRDGDGEDSLLGHRLQPTASHT